MPLIPLPKRRIILRQRKPVLDLIIRDPLHSLRTSLLRDWYRLHHREQLLLRRQLQHCQTLRSVPDV